MTSHLPSNEVELFRSLKKTAIVLMLLFRLDKPVGESQIARILDIHPETARIYLRSLVRLGLVTRTHRFNGWTLTAGGRQMILGESEDRWPVLGAGKIKTSAENPRSIPESPASSAENPRSTSESPAASAENPRSIPQALTPSAENPRSIPESPSSSAENPRSILEGPGASAENPRSIPESPSSSAENPRSIPEGPAASAEKPRSTAEKPRSSAEIPRSRPAAAASLSLSFKKKRIAAAAAIARTSVKNSRSSVKISRSRYSRRLPNTKKKDRTASWRARSDPVVRANLGAFGSIGVTSNEFVLEICKMDHVTPDYILGQAKRLQAERRYSHGLLLTVIRSHDHLPEKYLTPENANSQPQLLVTETQLEVEPDPVPAIEPDRSVYEPISAGGMTGEKAWSAALRQLKVDMPKAAYDKWVADTVLFSAKDGVFIIGAQDPYARDWLEGRLSSTVTRFLAGICNPPVEVRFVSIGDIS